MPLRHVRFSTLGGVAKHFFLVLHPNIAVFITNKKVRSLRSAPNSTLRIVATQLLVYRKSREYQLALVLSVNGCMKLCSDIILPYKFDGINKFLMHAENITLANKKPPTRLVDFYLLFI